MATPILPTQSSEQQPPIRVLPDIATVCSVCKRGFKDEHFISLIWLDPHTPLHRHCATSEQVKTNSL